MVVENRFFIGFNSCNKQLGLSNQGILNMFMDVASIHGNIAGEDITKVSTRWLLSAYHVKFIRRPIYGEFVTVKTWGRSIKGVLSCREFGVYDENGNLICIANSNWAHVDSIERKLVRVSEELAENYDCEEDRHNFDDFHVEKLFPNDNMAFVKSIVIDRDKLDSNGHVNNVKYLAMADTVLPEEKYIHESNEFIINYKKEIFKDEKVDLYYSEDDSYYYVMMKSGNNVNSIIKYTK